MEDEEAAAAIQGETVLAIILYSTAKWITELLINIMQILCGKGRKYGESSSLGGWCC